MKPTKEYAQQIFQTLREHYPNAQMILRWSNNWELLVAIILSAQCTDKKVNEVTAVLFPKYKAKRKELESQYSDFSRMVIPNHVSPRLRKEKIFSTELAYQDESLNQEEFTELINFAFVPITELEQDIRSTGFYHNKARNVQAAAKKVLDDFHGVFPKTIVEMTTIPGVGRKTANVFLGNAFGITEGIAVDTHVTKQAQLLGLTTKKTPEKIEQDLMQLFPKNQWFSLTYLLIEHGRNMQRRKDKREACRNAACLLHDNI